MLYESHGSERGVILEGTVPKELVYYIHITVNGILSRLYFFPQVLLDWNAPLVLRTPNRKSLRFGDVNEKCLQPLPNVPGLVIYWLADEAFLPFTLLFCRTPCILLASLRFRLARS